MHVTGKGGERRIFVVYHVFIEGLKNYQHVMFALTMATDGVYIVYSTTGIISGLMSMIRKMAAFCLTSARIRLAGQLLLLAALLVIIIFVVVALVVLVVLVIAVLVIAVVVMFIHEIQ